MKIKNIEDIDIDLFIYVLKYLDWKDNGFYLNKNDVNFKYQITETFKDFICMKI